MNLLRLIYTVILLIPFFSLQAVDDSHWQEKLNTEILTYTSQDRVLKFKAIAENDADCLVSFIVEFTHESTENFHVQVIMLDLDGFEIIRRPLANCVRNSAERDCTKCYYNIKGTFSVPCGFFERMKGAELKFYPNP